MKIIFQMLNFSIKITNSLIQLHDELFVLYQADSLLIFGLQALGVKLQEIFEFKLIRFAHFINKLGAYLSKPYQLIRS